LWTSIKAVNVTMYGTESCPTTHFNKPTMSYPKCVRTTSWTGGYFDSLKTIFQVKRGQRDKAKMLLVTLKISDVTWKKDDHLGSKWMYELTKFGLNTNYVEHQFSPPEGLTLKILCMLRWAVNYRNQTIRPHAVQNTGLVLFIKVCGKRLHAKIHYRMEESVWRHVLACFLPNCSSAIRFCTWSFPNPRLCCVRHSFKQGFLHGLIENIIISSTTARTGPWPSLTGFRDGLGMYDVGL
jgi:hypothetical protein